MCDAYGWPVTLTNEEILARLVALNAERAAEEAQGLIRWLRPEYQAPSEYGIRNTQYALIREDSPLYEVSLETRPLLPWPSRMAEQAQAVRAALVALGGPASATEVAAAFTAAPPSASQSCWRRWSRWGRRARRPRGVSWGSGCNYCSISVLRRYNSNLTRVRHWRIICVRRWRTDAINRREQRGMAVFFETPVFTRRVTELLSDDEYAELQKVLVADPNAGDLIPGSGGLR